MIVVVSDYVGPLRKTETHPGATIPGLEQATILSDNIDITVMHVRYWRQLIHENAIRLLYCMAIPKSMVLKEKEPLKLVLNYQRLKTNLYHYMKQRDRVSKSLWSTKQHWASKKQLLHVLRVLMVAHQLLNTGQITDYTTANFHYLECERTSHNTYEEFLDWYKARYNPLYISLKSKLNQYKAVFEDLGARTNALRILDYLQYHCTDDPAKLDTEVSVTLNVIDYPTTADGTEALSDDIFILQRSFDSPKHTAIQKCYRVVCSKNASHDHQSDDNPHWQVVAIAPTKYWEFGSDRYVQESYEKFVGKLDYTTTRVFKKPQGIGVLLFWYQGAFRAVFAASGTYTAQYAERHNTSVYQLGHVLNGPFWTMWRQKGFQLPTMEIAKSWTFEFVYHPDEEVLQLDAIMDHKSQVDISMATFSSIIETDACNEPLLIHFAQLMSWDFIEPIAVDFPSKKATSTNAVNKNMEVIQKMAMGARDMSLLRYEGFVLIDEQQTRVQVSLPQYHCIQLVASPYEWKYRTRHIMKCVRATLNLPAHNGMSGADRFCLYFPLWASWYRYVATVLRRVCEDMDTQYKTVANIADATEFKRTVEKISFTHAKVFWKLRSSGNKALDYFTDLANLNEGPGTQILQAWTDQFHAFADVNHDSLDE